MTKGVDEEEEEETSDEEEEDWYAQLDGPSGGRKTPAETVNAATPEAATAKAATTATAAALDGGSNTPVTFNVSRVKAIIARYLEKGEPGIYIDEQQLADEEGGGPDHGGKVEGTKAMQTPRAGGPAAGIHPPPGGGVGQ